MKKEELLKLIAENPLENQRFDLYCALHKMGFVAADELRDSTGKPLLKESDFTRDVYRLAPFTRWARDMMSQIDVPEEELMPRFREAQEAYRQAKKQLDFATACVKNAMLKHARAKVGDVVELVEKRPVMETLGWREENTKMTIGKVSVNEELVDGGAYRPAEDDFKALASYCIQYEGIAVLPDGSVSYPHRIDDDRVLELRKVERVK